MTYTIYAIGDGAFLAEILNSVAMLTGDNDFVYIGMIGALLGVVMAITSSVLKGGKSLPLGGPALGIILYLVMFVPRADVLVQDVYSSTVRPVDNVPIGVAVTGSLISHMGVYFTESFEQAYSIPGMLQTGYGLPLEMLLSVRGMGLGTANTISGTDNFRRTLSNYFKNCTMSGVLLDMKNPGKIATAPDPWAAIEFPSTAYTTKTYLPGDGVDGQTRTCDDAYAAIDSNWSQYLDAWNDYISHQYNVLDARNKIQASLNNLVEMGLDANKYMRATRIANMIRKVKSGDYVPGSFGANVIITQATEQANVQFAAEASMFAQYARPLMTFIEGFVYGISPFMAFVIGFGIAGFKLLGRYILILIWVVLWTPIMSISNLFCQMSFMDKMDALNGLLVSTGSPLSPMSLLGMQTMQNAASEWLATSGNLIAATPALALVVIYGGAYTMVSLAGRLNPTDTVDEKQAAPSLFTNPGVMGMASAHSWDPTMGMRQTGYEQTTPSLQLSQVASSSVASASTRLESAQAQFTHSRQAVLNEVASHGLTTQELQSWGNDVGLSRAQYQGSQFDVMDKYLAGTNYTDDQSAAIRGLYAATLSGGVGFSAGKGFNLSGGARSEYQVSSEVSDAVQQSEQLQKLFSDASSSGARQEFASRISASASDSDAQNWGLAWQSGMGEEYRSASQAMASAQKEFKQAQSFANSAGVQQEVSYLAMAKRIAEDPAAMQRVTEFQVSHDRMGNAITNQVDKLMREGNRELGDPDNPANEGRYQALGALMVMGGNMDNPDASQTLMDLAVDTGYVVPSMAPDNVNPWANEGLAPGLDAEGDVIKGTVTGATAGADEAAGRAAAQTDNAASIAREGQVPIHDAMSNLQDMWEIESVPRDELTTSGALYATMVPKALNNMHTDNTLYQQGVASTDMDKSTVRSLIFGGNGGSEERRATAEAIRAGDLSALAAMSESMRSQTITRDELPKLHERLVSQFHDYASDAGYSPAQADYVAQKSAAVWTSVVEQQMGIDGTATYHEVSSAIGRGAGEYASERASIDPKYADAVRAEIRNNTENDKFASASSHIVLKQLNQVSGTGLETMLRQDDLRTFNLGTNLTEGTGLKTGDEQYGRGYRPSTTDRDDLNAPGWE